MLANPLDEAELAALDPADYRAEWKWDGIRVQVVVRGRRPAALLAHRRRHRAPPSPTSSTASTSTPCSTASCWSCATARSRPSTTCSSGSTARPSTPKHAARVSRPSSGSTTSCRRDGEDLRRLAFAERRAPPRALARARRPRRASTSRRWSPSADLGRARGACAPRRARQAIEGLMLKRARQPLCRRPAQGPVVQVEARPADRRRRADVRPARPRQALLASIPTTPSASGAGADGRRAGAGRQGLFRLHRRGAEAARPLGARQHGRALRPGARGAPRAWCSRSPSTACSARPGTSPASPCASRASTASAGTSRPPRPTGSRRSRR